MNILKRGFLFLVFSFGVSVSAFAANGFDTVHTCNSYAALESEMNCGPDSYIPKFALPYCQKYLAESPSFSSSAQEVLAKIRSCLQEELLAQGASLTCGNIKDIGINSHYACYVDSGFCSLSESEVHKVMWIAKGQIFNGPVLAVFFQVQDVCHKQ